MDLKQAIESSGLTNMELAKKLECCSTQVSRWKNGRVIPGKRMRKLINRALKQKVYTLK